MKYVTRPNDYQMQHTIPDEQNLHVLRGTLVLALYTLFVQCLETSDKMAIYEKRG